MSRAFSAESSAFDDFITAALHWTCQNHGKRMNSKGNPPAVARTAVSHLHHPIRSLSIGFWLWKALVFAVIVACPRPGYDTSTTILPSTTATAPWLSSALEKFARWDSLYFLHVARNGYVFEQEWAFGYGYTKLLSFLASGISYIHHSSFQKRCRC